MHLVIFGHSHVWSVRRALAVMEADDRFYPGVTADVAACGTRELPGPVIYRMGAGDGAKPTLNPVIIATINRAQAGMAADSTWLVSMVQGNYYNQIGMIAQGGLFDFVLDSHPDLPLTPGATVLPCAAVRAVLTAQMAEYQPYAQILGKTVFGPRTILVGPPPPPDGEAEIAALLAADPKSDPAATSLITPALTRLKLWHMQNRLAAACCVAAGVQYLPGDLPGTTDAQGFLAPAFIKDAVHANHGYSTILLRRLAEMATGQKAATP